VQRAKRGGREVYFGDMYSSTTQAGAGLGKAAAVFVTSHDSDAAKAQALTLHELYPQLSLYVRVRTLAEQDALVAKGIKHAGPGYIESPLARGGILLKDLGVSGHDVSELVSTLRNDDCALIRKHGDQLIIEPVPPPRLLALLATLEPLDDEFPEFDDQPPGPVDL